ncbi:MAG: hypothetical protein NW202_13985 [Nitrospira sp.]|nr:hypothetical protein [Nitrospira sp.]
MASTTPANPTRTTRISRRNSESFNRVSKGFKTFSLKATDSGSNVAIEQLITSDNTVSRVRFCGRHA